MTKMYAICIRKHLKPSFVSFFTSFHKLVNHKFKSQQSPKNLLIRIILINRQSNVI